MSAVGVRVSTVLDQRTGAGLSPSTALQSIRVLPIPFVVAKRLIEKHHYTHSFPGGTMLAFGTSLNGQLTGAATFGAGPFNGFSLVRDARPEDCLTLTRLWLSDEMPHNSESRVIAIILRALKKNTSIKFILSYADPTHEHLGIIYQSSGWLYTGVSEAIPLYSIAKGKPSHSRSLGHVFGSHSLKHFAQHDIEVTIEPQLPKHRYIYFLDTTCRSKLRTNVLPYPKKGDADIEKWSLGRVRGSGKVATVAFSPCTPYFTVQGRRGVEV